MSQFQGQFLLNAVNANTNGAAVMIADSKFLTCFVEASAYGAGTVTIQVSWNGTYWHTLTLADGTAAAFADGKDHCFTIVAGRYLYYRATLTGATSPSAVTVIIQ
jgi:hypothetical protein